MRATKMASTLCAVALLLTSGCDSEESTPKGNTTTDVTWHEHVRPIIEANCLSCHSPGGIGPFELDTYAKAKPMAAAIGASVASGRMPPWMPAEDCQPMTGVRRLSQDEKDAVSAWAAAGAPEGDSAKYVKPNKAQSEGLARVDLKLELPKAYQPVKGAEGTDDYHCFILDPKLTKRAHLEGLRVIPDNKVMAHHAIVWAVDRKEVAGVESAPGEGWACYGGTGVDGDMVGGWVPGTSAMVYPKGTALRVEANQVFVVQMHYSFAALKGAPADKDQTKFEFQFANEPIMTVLKISSHAHANFSVPPAAKGYETSNVIKNGTKTRVWGVIPHMHQFGTAIDVKAGEGADARCVVNIPRWDFNWQQLYIFDANKPLILDEGTPLQLRCVYDNPTQTPLTWGEDTEDEMCLNYYIYSRVSVDELNTCIKDSCTAAHTSCVDSVVPRAYYCAINCEQVEGCEPLRQRVDGTTRAPSTASCRCHG